MSSSQPYTKPRKIILECQKNVPDEVAAILPSYNASRQLCTRNRVDPYESYDIPSDINFVLHDDFKVSEKKELFLIYDETYNEQDRMLIFSTEKNLQILNENRYWLCDGTFDAALSIFIQLFSMHNLKNGNNLPLVYGLFTNKQQATTVLGQPRTNNNLEGWHNALQSTIKSHPHLLCLISNLRLEQSNTENEYIKLSTGQVNKKKPKYIKLEEQISKIVSEFSDLKILDYLYNLSLLLKPEIT
ncbi:unnamed protein product [Brachionus calyciflorus]|uniref:MULE transposase domain-containing protein n=1 Tax=Brachionus calyciflorus TaxID=104777 RepID=A0A814B2U8_9BILA|nr:unnamed protein product [Brachionus calyciflorus]